MRVLVFCYALEREQSKTACVIKTKNRLFKTIAHKANYAQAIMIFIAHLEVRNYKHIPYLYLLIALSRDNT